MEECCNTIEQSIINAPTSGQNGGICGEEGAQTQFGETLDRVNGTREVRLAREIHEGKYIVSQRNFMYSCNGCIKSIQLAVSINSMVRDAQGQEKIKFHTFANRTGDKSMVQSVEDVTEWSSSVMMMKQDRHVVEYRPSGSSEMCFGQGDVFGFTIEAGSGVTLITRLASDRNEFVLNASSTLQTISGCPQLSDIGLYTTVGSFSVTPLIHIVTGKILLSILCIMHYIVSYFAGGFLAESPMTTTEPTIRATTKVTPDSSTTPSNPPPPNPTDPQTGCGSGSVIYAASGFAVAVCILFIVVIIVVILRYVIRRRNHNRNTQYRKTYSHGNSSKFVPSV